MDVTKRGTIHIAVNGHLLSGTESYRSAGVHRYIRRLISHLPDQEALTCTVLTHHGAAVGETDAKVRRTRWPTHRAPIRIIWEQCAQPLALRRLAADLVHGPVNVLPLVKACPAVVTVHDLSFIRFPHCFRVPQRLYQKVMTRASVQRADRVIAVSKHTAQEVSRLLGVPMATIDVVHHGVEPAFRPQPEPVIERFRRRCSLPRRFILFVGTLEPRKNLVRLVKAFNMLCDPELHLVLAGGKGWLYDELFVTVEALGLESRVLFQGYVDDSDLPLLYSAAETFVLPSLYEGFGFPIIEAQACGTPVVASETTALPEAAGGAACLVNPLSVEAMAESLHQVTNDQALRSRLRTKGLKNAAGFRWSKTAQRTAAAYRRALSGSDLP